MEFMAGNVGQKAIEIETAGKVHKSCGQARKSCRPGRSYWIEHR
jgi:hypothetical protein